MLDQAPRPDLGPWLQKRLTVVGSRGTGEAHVASHFKAWSTGRPLDTLGTNIQAYEASLARLYQALADPGHVRRAALASPEDQLHVLRIMTAILESERRRAPVALAEPVPETAPVAPAQPHPTVSVIVPLSDHRGMGLEAIESWTVTQRCAADLFEVIVLSDGTTADIEEGIRALLRPQDRLLRDDGINEMDHYHHGATLARGEVLLFTEPHCVAEPEAIAELVGHFSRNPTIDTACGRSEPICANYIARAELDMFEEGFLEWSRPGAWQKVILRAFAIRRRVYCEVDGFQYRHDRFAEWLLAATLHQRGYVQSYAPSCSCDRGGGA